MVSPINYRMDVLNPLEGYMQGLKFGEGLLTDRQGREATAQAMQERSQIMDIRGQQEQRAAQTFQMQRAAAQQQQAEAQAMQAQLMDLREMALNGTLTPEALDQFAVANASTFDEFRTAVEGMSAGKRQGDVQSAIQLSTSLLRGNTDAALTMLDDRIAAAENAGTPEAIAEAQSLRAIRGEIEIDPIGFATANLANLTAQGAIDSTTMKTVLDAAGQGGAATGTVQTQDQQLRLAGIVPISEGGDGRYERSMASAAGGTDEAKTTFRQASPEEAAQYGVTAGQIDTATGRFYPIDVPTGMTLETTADGGVRLVQGPGVTGSDTGKRSPDYVYETDDQGLPVARPIAGTPAAAEVQAQRGRLQSSVDVGQDMLRTVERLVGRPEGDGQTGIPEPEALAGILGNIQGRLPPRTQAQADLMAIYEQVTGRAFLEAFETLKGGGQITEVEGRQATQAIARLQRTQGTPAFKQSLFEFADIVRRGIERSRNELNVLPQVAPAQGGQTPSATGGRVQYDAQGNRVQ